MPDRTIILATNGRHGLRGLTQVNPQEFLAYQDSGDDLTYIADTAAFAEGATLSTVTRTAYGLTVTNTSNTTSRITQRIKGFGYVDIKFTTSGGDTDQFRIVVEPRAQSQYAQNYDPPIAMPLAYTSAVDPTIGDDSIDGHVPGTLWLNTATQNEFRCITNAVGAARWRHIPRVLAQSGGVLTVTGNTSENIAATIDVPANALGPNGRLELDWALGWTNNANNKTFRVRYSGISGAQFCTLVYTTAVATRDLRFIANRNSTSSQIGSTASKDTGLGATSVGTTASVDTTVATTLLLTCQLQNSADTMTIDDYTVVLTRPDIAP